jgi:hypothetical protein
MERIKNFIKWAADETVFWGEVIGEVLGFDRTKYTDIIEKRQQEIERENRLEIRKSLYEQLNQ